MIVCCRWSSLLFNVVLLVVMFFLCLLFVCLLLELVLLVCLQCHWLLLFECVRLVCFCCVDPRLLPCGFGVYVLLKM